MADGKAMKTNRRWVGLLLAALSAQVWAAGEAGLKPAAPVPLNPKIVTATKGPVKLVFEVANTKVRENDSLWVRLTLTNVGPRPMKLANDAFWNVLNLAGNEPLRIEVRETKSRREISRFTRMTILWTKELEKCLDRYETEHPSPEKQKVWTLKPGDSVSTPARPPMSDFALRHCENDPDPKLFPPYGEIPGWIWRKPSYEVRAVYDRRLSPELEKYLTEEGRRNRDSMILLATDWVPLTRVP